MECVMPASIAEARIVSTGSWVIAVGLVVRLKTRGQKNRRDGVRHGGLIPTPVIFCSISRNRLHPCSIWRTSPGLCSSRRRISSLAWRRSRLSSSRSRNRWSSKGLWHNPQPGSSLFSSRVSPGYSAIYSAGTGSAKANYFPGIAARRCGSRMAPS